MEPAFQWSLDFYNFVQTLANPQLAVVMRAFLFLGSAPMYVITIPLICWCVDEKKGIRLGAAVLISAWINIVLRFLINRPEPLFTAYDPLAGVINGGSGGFPSGYAQNSAVMLFIAASWFKRKTAFGIAALLCLLICFSGICLGAHFPVDVLGGWIAGALVLCAYFLLRGGIEAFLKKGGFRAGVIASAGLSFLMILYLPSEEFLMPGGTLLGMGTGYCLNFRYAGFTSSLSGRTGMAKCLILLVRFLLGICGLLLIFVLIGKAIPRNSGNHNLYGFIRFAIAGLWVCAGAPWLYIKLRLAAGRKE